MGNYKTKYGFKRERAPFIFTPDFAFIMGGRGSAKFNDFVKICCNAYNIVRKHSNVFINLFELVSFFFSKKVNVTELFYKPIDAFNRNSRAPIS